MQHCDSTCDHCAREFWAWWKDRAFAGRYREGRSGPASFDGESITSREKDKREMKTIDAETSKDEAMEGAEEAFSALVGAIDDKNDALSDIENSAQNVVDPDDFEDVDDLKGVISDMNAALHSIMGVASKAQQ